MPKISDRTGQRFGRLVAVERVGKSSRRQSLWLCLCDCGNTTVVTTDKLANGNTKSCGCHRADFARTLPHDKKITHGHSTRRHGKSPEYFVWQGMKDRCLREKSISYKRYGGRGIAVCEKWRDSFQAFLADMGQRPSAAHTLDRINNDGNYEPGNCRWALAQEQSANSASTRLVTVRGEVLSIADARRKFAPDMPKGTLSARLAKGWSIEEALFSPRRQ